MLHRDERLLSLTSSAKHQQLITELTVKPNWVKEAGFTAFKLTREWLRDLVILNVCFVCLFVRVLHANVMQSIMSHFALSDFELETQALLIIFSPGCSVILQKSFKTKIQWDPKGTKCLPMITNMPRTNVIQWDTFSYMKLQAKSLISRWMFCLLHLVGKALESKQSPQKSSWVFVRTCSKSCRRLFVACQQTGKQNKHIISPSLSIIPLLT